MAVSCSLQKPNPDLRTDYVLATPPLNDSKWFPKNDDISDET
jgi:hypothetical protein